MKYARVVDGVVREVVDLHDSWAPGVNIYHPDIAHQFHTVPQNVKVAEGWRFDGKAFSPPKPQEHSQPTSNRPEEEHDKGKEQH